ncbi:MAG TPA: sigma-54 dependent transcriptional regulator [Marinagarivorans sp.]|nr:sigma-54 dependent transcriptional regulator [Marinagarivorans sp.]HNG59609.1 sigma-54 dependent transcriptional regulator [Cellvibrionaceae bacterium]
MSEDSKQPMVLSLEGGNAQPLSVRAKALVFSDPVSARLLEYIERIAPSEAPVLIGGETGTGKELVARHIHLLSGRKGPFLAVNCGAISDQLVESELFGHEAGSFTGAVGKREGWFEAANGGTLFLDEIGDLPLAMQVKLLRVLQEGEIVRIGSRKSIRVDVRLVAATNVDLDFAVNAGHFRRDLLFRINIAQVNLPPLRERPGDILPLADFFLKQYCQRMGYEIPQMSQEASNLLLNHFWPGNIRELENVVHFALLVAGEGRIEMEHIKVAGGWKAGLEHTKPIDITINGAAQGVIPIAAAPTNQESPVDIIKNQLRHLFRDNSPYGHFDKLEEVIVTEAFQHAKRNQVHTAALLGISRNVMRTLLKRHGFIHDSPVFDLANSNFPRENIN